jgi:hypothetical protein
LKLLFAVALVVAVASGCPQPSRAWNSVVVSNDGQTVCTRELEPGDAHPGGAEPCIQADGSNGGRVEPPVDQLAVGDCVRMNIHHPTLVLEAEVPCLGG